MNPTPETNASSSSAGSLMKLKRGEHLFKEGDTSSAMYFLKSGIIRIYKMRGDSPIEIDTIRSGSVLGELAFLDGKPRSASGEALTECELLVISTDVLQATLSKSPEWVKILLRTIVGRLRAASTKIRQLEQASVQYETDKSGRRSATYTFLPASDILKISSALILCASRYAKNDKFPSVLLERYANQMMQVPDAKVLSFVEILCELKVAKKEGDEIQILDLDFLEQFSFFLNDQALLEPTKKQELTLKGFIIMSAIYKHLGEFTADPTTGKTTVNMVKVHRESSKVAGRELFRMDEMPELAKIGFTSTLKVISTDEMIVELDAKAFEKSYRFHRVLKAIEALNTQKRK
jgi:CRP-like cAMP-binding protein